VIYAHRIEVLDRIKQIKDMGYVRTRRRGDTARAIKLFNHL